MYLCWYYFQIVSWGEYFQLNKESRGECFGGLKLEGLIFLQIYILGPLVIIKEARANYPEFSGFKPKLFPGQEGPRPISFEPYRNYVVAKDPRPKNAKRTKNNLNKTVAHAGCISEKTVHCQPFRIQVKVQMENIPPKF